MSGFFFGPFYKRVARGAFSLTLTCRTILPLSFGGDFQCIHLYPSSWARLEFVQWSSSRRSFAKMLWRTSPKQSRDNRRQQVTVFRAKMRRPSDSIAEETDSSPDPEEERQQHSCSLLSISLTSEFAHTALSQLFFFGAKRFKRKEFPAVWLTAQRMRVGFWRLEPELSQTSQNASMRRCHPPFFLFHYPLLWPRILSGDPGAWRDVRRRLDRCNSISVGCSKSCIMFASCDFLLQLRNWHIGLFLFLWLLRSRPANQPFVVFGEANGSICQVHRGQEAFFAEDVFCTWTRMPPCSRCCGLRLEITSLWIPRFAF